MKRSNEPGNPGHPLTYSELKLGVVPDDLHPSYQAVVTLLQQGGICRRNEQGQWMIITTTTIRSVKAVTIQALIRQGVLCVQERETSS